MNNGRENTKVQVMGKEFMVACAPEEKEKLQTATRFLDDQIENVQRQGKIIGNDRIAIMVAINLASELLDLREQQNENSQLTGKLQRLSEKISQEINS